MTVKPGGDCDTGRGSMPTGTLETQLFACSACWPARSATIRGWSPLLAAVRSNSQPLVRPPNGDVARCLARAGAKGLSLPVA